MIVRFFICTIKLVEWCLCQPTKPRKYLQLVNSFYKSNKSLNIENIIQEEYLKEKKHVFIPFSSLQ